MDLSTITAQQSAQMLDLLAVPSRLQTLEGSSTAGALDGLAQPTQDLSSALDGASASGDPGNDLLGTMTSLDATKLGYDVQGRLLDAQSTMLGSLVDLVA